MKIKKDDFSMSFFIVFIILLLITTFSVKNIYELNNNSKSVVHTYEVKIALINNLSLLKDVETNARGFALTGNRDFLESIALTKSEIQKNILNLQLLLKDNPNKLLILESLKKLIDLRIAESSKLINARDRLGLNEAIKIISTQRGKEIMDDIRKISNNMEKAEDTFLIERNKIATDSYFLAQIFAVAGSIISIFFTLLLIILNKKSLKLKKNLLQSEEEFKQSSQYARSLIEASLDPLVTISADGKITDVNEGSIKVTGLFREKLIGTDFSDYFTEPRKAREGYKQVFAKGSVTDYPLTIRHKNGQLTDVLYNASVYTNEVGVVLGVFAAARDITVKKDLEKKLAEVAISQETKIVERTAQLGEKVKDLEEANAKDEAILLSLGDALVVVDQEGKIGFVNKAFEELLGWKKEEVLGKRMVDIIPREDETGLEVSFEERILSSVLAGKKVTTTTTTATTATTPIVVLPAYYYIRKDKTRFPAAGVVSPILLAGKIIGAVEIFRDITKEKEIDKAKSEFVSLASHQLKTPPTIISLYTEQMLREHGEVLNANQKKYIEEIRTANQRMIDIVNALLDVSRIELGSFAVNSSQHDVVSMVKDMLHDLKSHMKERNLTLETSYQKESLILSVDESLLRMVFYNLISNAIKYSSKVGTIRIEIKEVTEGKKVDTQVMLEDSLVVSVYNTSSGIPENQQAQIFTKFFRADNAKIQQTDGTGLGLYIAKSILYNSSGTIWFKSEENKGVTFYVTIPLTGMKQKKISSII